MQNHCHRKPWHHQAALKSRDSRVPNSRLKLPLALSINIYPSFYCLMLAMLKQSRRPSGSPGQIARERGQGTAKFSSTGKPDEGTKVGIVQRGKHWGGA